MLLLELWTVFWEDELELDFEDPEVEVFELEDEEVLLFEDDDFRFADDGSWEEGLADGVFDGSASFSELESDRWFSAETGLYGGIVFTLPPFF